MRSIFHEVVQNLIPRFSRNQGGAVAIMFGIALIGIIGLAGFAIDYARATSARTQLQSGLDAAVLAVVKTPGTDPAVMKAAAEAFFKANPAYAGAISWTLETPVIDASTGAVSLTARGRINTTLLAVLGQQEMEFSVTTSATRSVGDTAVEMALVLDNTWSMSASAGGGLSKIDALKTAAKKLVTTMIKDSTTPARVSIVPFADYVNVGLDNRTQPWMSVPDDYQQTQEGYCVTRTTKTVCSPPTQTGCTENRDGIVRPVPCSWVCTQVPIEPVETCYPARTTQFKWYGCVNSRRNGLHVTDAQTEVPYKGWVSYSRECLNPIVRLTNDKAMLQSAIDGLIINVGSYKPATYIPSGLMWGINTLSSTVTWKDGAAPDPANRKPRKALVLMTDGSNTLRLRPDGYLSDISSPGHRSQTDTDTDTLCSLAKSKGIEVFTIAFAVEDELAKTLIRKCASDPSHYFDASDTSALMSAFDAIGASMSNLRLTH